MNDEEPEYKYCFDCKKVTHVLCDQIDESHGSKCMFQ